MQIDTLCKEVAPSGIEAAALAYMLSLLGSDPPLFVTVFIFFFATLAGAASMIVSGLGSQEATTVGLLTLNRRTGDCRHGDPAGGNAEVQYRGWTLLRAASAVVRTHYKISRYAPQFIKGYNSTGCSNVVKIGSRILFF